MFIKFQNSNINEKNICFKVQNFPKISIFQNYKKKKLISKNSKNVHKISKFSKFQNGKIFKKFQKFQFS